MHFFIFPTTFLQTAVNVNSHLSLLFLPQPSLLLLIVRDLTLSLQDLLLNAIQFLQCQFGEFGVGLSNNQLIDIFLNSHHLSA